MSAPAWFYALSGAAVISARTVAHYSPKHLPIARLLFFGLACDIALLCPIPRSTAVIAGAVYPWAVTWVCARILGKPAPPTLRRPSRLVVIFSLYVAAMLVLDLRGRSIELAYSVAQGWLAVLLITLAVRWWRGRHEYNVTALSAHACAAAEVLNAAGPLWMLPESWKLARTTYAACYCGLCTLQGAALWRRSRTAMRRGSAWSRWD